MLTPSLLKECDLYIFEIKTGHRQRMLLSNLPYLMHYSWWVQTNSMSTSVSQCKHIFKFSKTIYTILFCLKFNICVKYNPMRTIPAVISVIKMMLWQHNTLESLDAWCRAHWFIWCISVSICTNASVAPSVSAGEFQSFQLLGSIWPI